MAFVQLAFERLPYATAAVFFAGMLWRIRRHARAAAGRAPLFPVPAKGPALWRNIAVEICLLRGRQAVNPPSGPFSNPAGWCFHAALALLLVGHIRAVTDFPRLWATLGLTPAGVDRFAALAGGAAGLLALAAGLTLLLRRLVLPRLRDITRVGDVFALGLLLAVIVSGLAMRLGPPVDLQPVRTYLADLAALRPGPMPQSPGFALHFLLAQALAVYAPFGKLLHIAAVFPAKAGLARGAATGGRPEPGPSRPPAPAG